jgi:hypothetical protein
MILSYKITLWFSTYTEEAAAWSEDFSLMFRLARAGSGTGYCREQGDETKATYLSSEIFLKLC